MSVPVLSLAEFAVNTQTNTQMMQIMHILFVIFKLALYAAASMFLVCFVNIFRHFHYEIKRTKRGTVIRLSIRIDDVLVKTEQKRDVCSLVIRIS